MEDTTEKNLINSIKKENKDIIHKIIIVFDPYIDTERNLINYSKKLLIDNYGDIYSLITLQYMNSKPSVCSHTIEHPKIRSPYPLSNVIIEYIKKLDSKFTFRAIDYTSSIHNIISNLKSISDNLESSNSYVKLIEDENLQSNKLLNSIKSENLEKDKLIKTLSVENHEKNKLINSLRVENMKYRSNWCNIIKEIFCCSKNKIN
jgi:hypothetical protein